MSKDGHGVGSCICLNSGCMSHGDIGSKTSGLSKAMSMMLSVLICPEKYNKPMDFSLAFYTVDVSDIPRRHLEILWFLNNAVTKHYWVSWLGFRVREVGKQKAVTNLDLNLTLRFLILSDLSNG